MCRRSAAVLRLPMRSSWSTASASCAQARCSAARVRWPILLDPATLNDPPVDPILLRALRHAEHHGHLESGQTVLIHGAAGGVGTFAVQLAHWKGARVLATASAANLEYLRSLGAVVAIDYKATRFEAVAKDVDLVLDLIGGETQQRSFAVLKPGGYLVSVVQPPSQELAAKHRVHAVIMRMQPWTANLEQLARLLDAGTIRTVVTKTHPLSQAREAWKDIMSGHTRGKIVLEVPE